MKQVRVFISGFVQGVGYRRFIKYHAKKLGVMGYAKNLPDDRVEVVLQGDEEVLKKMIHICNKGPFLSEVKNVILEWEESLENFTGFEIRW